MPLEFKMYSYIGPEPLRTSVPLLPATRKSTASSSAQSPPPSGLPPPPSFATAYQLDIVSALRGSDHNFLSRAAVADAISAIDSEEHKLQLIDFLVAEQGVIALTLENNACKAFECTPSELFVMAQRAGEEPRDQVAFLRKLVQLFQTTLHKILPNTFGMVYPLQQFDSSFELREIVLHYFRDRVLLSLLDYFRFERKMFERYPQLERELRQMFLMINLDVRDESDEAECFNQIFDEFLGNSSRTQTFSSEDSAETVSANKRKFSSGSKPISGRGRRMHRAMRPTAAHSEGVPDADPKMPAQRYRKSFSPSPKLFMAKEEGKSKEEEAAPHQQKERARTLPSKTVTFWDDDTTVDV